MNRSKTQSRIPEFHTYAEEAEFWDTHDTTDFEDEFEPVEVTFAQPLIRRGIIVPLESQLIAQLRRLAHENKIEPAVLAQHWIMDRLRMEGAPSA